MDGFKVAVALREAGLSEEAAARLAAWEKDLSARALETIQALGSEVRPLLEWTSQLVMSEGNFKLKTRFAALALSEPDIARHMCQWLLRPIYTLRPDPEQGTVAERLLHMLADSPITLEPVDDLYLEAFRIPGVELTDMSQVPYGQLQLALELPHYTFDLWRRIYEPFRLLRLREGGAIVYLHVAGAYRIHCFYQSERSRALVRRIGARKAVLTRRSRLLESMD